MSTTIAQALKDGGTDFSKMITLIISASSPDTETGYFLLGKASTGVSSYADVELIAICSPEDINTYGTTPVPTGYYRSPSGMWVFPDSTKMTESVNSITADVAAAVSAYRKSVSPSGVYTAATTGTLSSMPAFSDDL